jgi:glutathione peroxidase
MAGLQVLEETFSEQGLEVLGFYSNDFGNQGGDDEDIEGCTDQYAVTFDQFAPGHVIDPDGAGPQVPQPVWQWLSQQPGFVAPEWNFHKYLISRSGELVQHFSRSVYPGDDPNNPNDSFDTNEIVVAIQAELAK